MLSLQARVGEPITFSYYHSLAISIRNFEFKPEYRFRGSAGMIVEFPTVNPLSELCLYAIYNLSSFSLEFFPFDTSSSSFGAEVRQG